MKYIILWILVCLSSTVNAQDFVEGKILQDNKQPIMGANIYWTNSAIGVVSDENGYYKIPYNKDYKTLTISYVGFKDKLVSVDKPSTLNITLQENADLDEVVVTAERKATEISFMNQKNVTVLNEKELLKAACCNLSESFETNPSVDVSFSDAVTGTKHIEMLGLTNPYILITQENIPSIRGASQAYGLTFTPGTWLESIQITKGAGSVVNGYESIAGQINTELKKPCSGEKLFINAYGSMNGRLEFNLNSNHKISDTWSTGLYTHVNDRSLKADMNDDGFLDAPLMNQYNIMNRWKYYNGKTGWVSFTDLRFMKDEKVAGQVDFNPDLHALSTTYWGSKIGTRRFDFSNKTGYVFNPDLPYKSIGLQSAFSNHEQNSYFGLRQYNINHKSWYSNLVYNTIIGNTRNTLKTGLSFTFDYYKEFMISDMFSRKDNSFGIFGEYTFDNSDNFSVVAGVRLDTHNRLGLFVTPRVHLRYNPWEKGVLRASVGRGKRTANIFAENQHYLASSRNVLIQNSGGEIYGLDPEIAWNYGLSFLQGFNLFGRNSNISAEYYATNFTDKVVVDVDSSPQEVSYYNLEGKSIAHSVQTDFNMNLAKDFDLRLSYKFYDVTTDYNAGRLSQPLLAKHRVFANLSYQTHYLNDKGSRWKFDATWHWNGKKRLPNTESNPIQYQLQEYSNPFSNLNAQVTKVFTKQFEIYLGAENLLSYRQENPILGADNPFGSHFDSTILYAPVMGARVYTGLRFKLN